MFMSEKTWYHKHVNFLQINSVQFREKKKNLKKKKKKEIKCHPMTKDPTSCKMSLTEELF